MNWFKGTITEAIIKSKNSGAVFVVYIEGKDEQSVHFTELLNSEEVAEKLGSDKFVAIKLEAGTLPHQQFSEIYKETPIPSVYFIGKQGTPLEIVKDSEDVKSLSASVDGVLKKAGLYVERSTAKQSETLIESEKQPPTDIVCENGVCTIKKDPPTNEPSTSSTQEKHEITENQPELTTEEKVEKAKQLIEKKREDKRRQEEEEERMKEIERRKVGKDVAELKRWQNEQELKQLLELREREKREGQAARERVLAQIAQDKAERAAKFSNITPAPTSPQPSTSQSPPPPPPHSATKPINTNVVRLQFRIPDGKSITQDFKIDDTLADVHIFIDNNIQLPFVNYTLSTTFPRRDYTNEDRQRSLLELELAPTAVLLILPIGGAGGGPIAPIRNIGINGLFWSLIGPLLSIFSYLKGIVFGSSSGNTNTETNKRTADTSTDANRFQQKRRAGETTVIRRQGNVHRLSNRNDSDDENNTWNGNSTQQM